MASTRQISESNGAEAVHDGITNLNFGNNDNYNLAANTVNSVVASLNSFEKYIRIKFAGTFTEISNMKFWKSSGAYGAGESIKAAANVAFALPSATANADSDVPTVVGSALVIQSAAGTLTITGAGYTKYIRLQWRSTSSTPSGAISQKVFSFQFDEV